MENYKPNSHRFKEEQKESISDKKIEKVISGKAKVKKKSELSKFKDVFVAEDASSVKSYIVTDVLIPAVKKLIYDIFTDGIDMVLYGGSGRGKKHSGISDKISYRNYYDRRDDRRPSDDRRARSRFDYDDILFETRGEAEAVRDQMEDVIDRYGFVTVADMYDMAELSAPYTSNKYGWTSIRNAEPVRTRDGYILKLPKALPID